MSEKPKSVIIVGKEQTLFYTISSSNIRNMLTTITCKIQAPEPAASPSQLASLKQASR